MIRRLPRNIGRFILLILLQVFVISNIEFSQYVNIYYYVIFILLLPFQTAKWLLLLSSFLLGLSIDVFTGTLGVHAMASVFAAYLRPVILELFAPRDGYESGTLPRVSYYGLQWFLNYTLIIVFAHHLVLFYFEVFTFVNFFHTLLRVILSTIFTSLLIVISQFLVFRK